MRHKSIIALTVLALSLLIAACGKENVDAELLKAAEVGNLGKVQQLLGKGADPNTTDEFKRTPLMIASLNGHGEIASLLVKAGANVAARAKYGQTALQFASEAGHATIVELLKAAKAVNPPNAPPPKGPYSQAMIWQDLVFVSGQGPVDRATGEVMHGDVLEEMAVAIENTRLILEAAGSSLENVLKATVYLADMNDLARVNEKYKEYFGPVFPALTTVKADMPFDIKIEIDVIAHKK